MKSSRVNALLSFNGGFVDTVGFPALQGLFTAHVTGNFVTLGATIVSGTHGFVGKILALPEFIVVVALARLAGSALRARDLPAQRVLLATKVAFLFAFFLLGVTLGPFPNSDAPGALITGFAGIAAMAIQNAVQRVHFASQPPTTLMTGSTTQIVIDVIDLVQGIPAEDAKAIRARAVRLIRSVLWFAAGCSAAAALYLWIGLWSFAIPVVVGLASAATRIQD
jgi:uncharacterized membrane protein YoaK (UPF0700 family)